MQAKTIDLEDLILRPETIVAIRRREVQPAHDVFADYEQVIEVGFNNGKWLEIDRMHRSRGAMYVPPDPKQAEKFHLRMETSNQEKLAKCLERHALFCEKLGFT